MACSNPRQFGQELHCISGSRSVVCSNPRQFGQELHCISGSRSVACSNPRQFGQELHCSSGSRSVACSNPRQFGKELRCQLQWQKDRPESLGKAPSATSPSPFLVVNDIHLRSLLWMYCPGHAGVTENDRTERLAGQAKITSGLLLERSEVLRSLRQYLRAPSQRHQAEAWEEEALGDLP